MKILIRREPWGAIDEDQSRYTVATLETSGSRCMIRAKNKDDVDFYKDIIASSSYATEYKDDSYLIKALNVDYGQRLIVDNTPEFKKFDFEKESSQLKVSTTFRYLK